uniref:Uncharacterized protein n=1 Tax=Clastoptera arizonana TaxID=38151 RepID=A0A1B6DZ15_9HEMI
MKKTIRPIISKKYTTPSKNTRSSKVKCSTHGSVYCREPCNVNLGENCLGINPCSSKEDHRTNQSKKHTNINEMLNTNVYKSTHRNDITHKKESQKLSRPSKVADLDQSVDMIPIKLKQQGYIVDKVASVKDDDSSKSTQNIKRTTWDCILRDQNTNLIQTKSMLRQENFVANRKSVSNHSSELEETSEYLKKSKLNKSNNDNELILNQCNYRCCLHNKLSTVNDKIDSHIRNKQNPLNPCLSSDQQIGINFDSNKSLFLSTDPAKALDLLVKELRVKLQRDSK